MRLQKELKRDYYYFFMFRLISLIASHIGPYRDAFKANTHLIFTRFTLRNASNLKLDWEDTNY